MEPFQAYAHVADERRPGLRTSHHGLIYHNTAYWKKRRIGFDGERSSIAPPTLGLTTVNEDKSTMITHLLYVNRETRSSATSDKPPDAVQAMLCCLRFIGLILPPPDFYQFLYNLTPSTDPTVRWRGICYGDVAVCYCVCHVDVLFPNDCVDHRTTFTRL